jgi:hypothetical protein
VGAKIEIPVKSEYQSQFGTKIVFRIADKNHSGYPSNSVTLITDKIIQLLAFDGKEPNNANSDRQRFGSNNYKYSNLRQWLNSNAAAGAWYNLFDPSAEPSVLNFAVISDYDIQARKITVSSTVSHTWSFAQYTISGLLPDTKYRLSLTISTNDNSYCAVNDSNETWISEGNATFTAPADGTIIIKFFATRDVASIDSVTFSNIQLECGTTDAPPNSSNVSENAYDTRAGFLAIFDAAFVNALMNTTLTVVKNTVTDGGSYETVTDKMFLASTTEVGLENENSIAEGSILSWFNTASNRIAYCTQEAIDTSTYTYDPTTSDAWFWWLRTPHSSNARGVRCVSTDGALSYDSANAGCNGVRPLCNLSSGILVSDTTNADGCYTIIWWTPPDMVFDINNVKKAYDNGWCKINGSLKQIDKVWTKINGVLREV